MDNRAVLGTPDAMQMKRFTCTARRHLSKSHRATAELVFSFESSSSPKVEQRSTDDRDQGHGQGRRENPVFERSIKIPHGQSLPPGIARTGQFIDELVCRRSYSRVCGRCFNQFRCPVLVEPEVPAVPSFKWEFDRARCSHMIAESKIFRLPH